MPKPIAVLISDIHYNLQNLKLADAAMRMAIDKANELDVPLIVAGDLHDTKANLRGECVNAMLKTFNLCSQHVFILVGNHDRINEKSPENSIGFLDREFVPESDNYYSGNTDRVSFREIVTKPVFTNEIGINGMSLQFIPYSHDVDEVRKHLARVDKGSTLIMHQGIQGSNMGDYFQDKSALNPEDVSGFRVISGHYHARQTIALPDGGKWDYIGNPYTVSYGEANDPEKGFQILMDDGSLEFVPTNLRKHVVYNVAQGDKELVVTHNPGDLMWIKLTGTKEWLSGINRNKYTGFRIDLIPLDTKSDRQLTPKVSNVELFDSLIDSLTNTSDERKLRLKELYKHLGS